MTHETAAEPRVSARIGTALLALGMVLLLSAAGVFIVNYRVYHVLSDSMTGTLRPGDRIIADSSFDGDDGVARGDIVMLDEAAWPDEPEHTMLVKRVVALGGDTVSYTIGSRRLRVSGRPIAEDYLLDGIKPASEDFSVAVPDGQVFVMGDNRPPSIDSRPHRGEARGPVAASAIRGRVVATVFPPDRFGELAATRSFVPFGSPREADPVLRLIGAAGLAGVAILLLAAVAWLFGRLRRPS